MTTSPLEGQTFGGEPLLVRYIDFVKLPHTVFALPFSFLGVVYASARTQVTFGQGLLVLIAFTAARFAAMGFNRIADRHYDAINPRTIGEGAAGEGSGSCRPRCRCAEPGGGMVGGAQSYGSRA